MSNGVNFKDLCIDLRGQLDRVTAERDAALGRESRAKEGLAKHWKVVCDQRSKIDALQALLTAAGERVRELEGLLRNASAWIKRNSCHGTDAIELWERIDAALKPAEGGGDA